MTSLAEKIFLKDFSFNPFPVFFYEWYTANLLTPWPNIEYAPVLIENINENTFSLMNDVSPLKKFVKKTIKELIKLISSQK